MIWFSWVLSVIQLGWRFYASILLPRKAIRCSKFGTFLVCEPSLLEKALDLSTLERKTPEVLCDFLLIKARCFFEGETVKVSRNKVKGEYFLRVRPNKTLEARKKLEQVSKLCCRLAALFFTFGFLLVAEASLLFKQSISFEGCKDSHADDTTLIYWWRLVTTANCSSNRRDDHFYRWNHLRVDRQFRFSTPLAAHSPKYFRSPPRTLSSTVNFLSQATR